MLAFIHIEDGHIDDQTLVGAAGGADDIARVGTRIDHEGEVAVHGLERRQMQQRPRGGSAGLAFFLLGRRDQMQVDDDADRRAVDVHRAQHRRVNVAERGERIGAEPEHPRPAGVVPGGGVPGDLQVGDRRAGGFERRIGIGPGVKGVDVALRHAPVARIVFAGTDGGGDDGLAVIPVAGIFGPDLEQRHVGIAPVGIAAGGVQQVGQDRRAHGVEIGRNRIVDHQRLVIEAEQLRGVPLHEGERHRLGHAARGQCPTRCGFAPLADRPGRRGDRGPARQRHHGDVVIAAYTQHFFDQIGFAVDILTPGRHGGADGAALVHRLEPEIGQNAHLFFAGHIQAAQRRDTRLAQRHLARPGRHVAGDRQLGRFAAAEIEDHPGRDMGAPIRTFGIDAALEAVARIRHDAELAARRRRADRIEQRDFEEHIGRVLGNAGYFAAHDAADGLDAVVVGDDGHRGIKLVFLAVQRQHLLAVFGEPHGDVALHLSRVEYVQRPGQIEGDVVGDVDQRRNRAQADGAQTVLQPLRAGTVFHAFEIAAHHQRAGILGVCGQIALPLDRRGERAARLRRIQRFQRAEPGGGQIAGDAADTGAVLAVGRQANLDDGIAQPERIDGGRADFGFVGQLDDAFVIVGQAHLAFGQQHAVRFLAADLAFLQRHVDAGDIGAGRGEYALHAGPRVGRAAHHLHRVAVAVIDHADLQPVGVGVLPGGNNMRDAERGERFGAVFHAFDLEPDHRQLFDDVGDRPVGFQVFFEPVERELHRPAPPTSPAATLGTSSGAKP